MPSPSIHLSAIYVYPIKGMRGISLTQTELDAFGVRYDRRFMLVNSEGVFMTQRTHPRLVLVHGQFEQAGLRLSAPEMGDIAIDPDTADGREERVVVWRDRVTARAGPEAASEWFRDFLQTDCRLVFMPSDSVRIKSGTPGLEGGSRIAFSDSSPLHVLSEASLHDLNGRLDEPVGMERFRPNLVIRGAEPYAEDGWTRFRIGDVEMRGLAPCTRCVVTTVDPRRGEPGKEPLRTLATYRKGEGGVEFGRYVAHRGPGVIRVGDRVHA